MDIGYYAVKVVHVLLAIAWLGGAAFNAFVIVPLVTQATEPTRREFMGRLAPASTKFFNAIGGLTLLSGLALVSLHDHGWTGLTVSRWGKTVLFVIIATALVLYLANFAVRSTLKALGQIMAQLPPGGPVPPQVRFLQARLRFSSFLVVGLLVLVAAMMVYANQLWYGPA